MILIYLITFPKLNPSFGTGLDASYVWAFNYLFNNNFDILRQLVYPIGPLGFLKFPTTEGNNLVLAIIFYSIIKLWFLTAFLLLPGRQPVRLKFVQILLALIMAFFLLLDFLIAGIAIIHVLMMLESRRWWHIIPVSMMVIIGLLIKSSVGILSMMVLFAGWCLYAIRYKSMRESLRQAAIALSVITIIGSVVLGGVGKCIIFIINILRLSLEYSEALALFPSNNWWLLVGFILTILTIPVLNRDYQTRSFLFC